MKRILLFITYVLVSINMLAQEDYRPLVEEGKHWTYDNYMPDRPAKYNHYYFYDLRGDTLIAGKNSLKLYSDNRYNDNIVRYEGALYEENKKVYCFLPEKEEAVLLYDFDCEVGDTIHVNAGKMVVKDIQTEDNGGIPIKKYTFHNNVFWIEGVGAMMDFFSMVPFTGNYNSLNACELNGEKLYQTVAPVMTMITEGKRWNYIHCYIDEDGEHRDPYSYVVKGDTIINRTFYKKLWYQDEKTEKLVCVLLEAGHELFKKYDNSYMMSFFDYGRDDFGRVFTWKAEENWGNTNWMVYGVDTIEVNNRPFRRYTCLQKYSKEGETLTTIEYNGEGVWHDIWVEGIGSASSGIEDQIPSHEPPVKSTSDYTHFVSCYENGECIFTADDFNAPAIKPGIDVPYRPFVEEGKVWQVGAIGSNPVQMVEYYYFDGDTIIDGKTCKQMMRQRYVNPEYPDYAIAMQYPLLQYVGAWYEEDKKVYFYNASSKQFTLMYDFSVDANDTLRIDNLPYVIGARQTGGINGFKGVYRDVMMPWDGEQNIYNTTWLEGVGNIDGPIYNVYYGEEYHALFLMSCTVGDEVIYLNDEYEDGATPDAMKGKKRFDFTHTIKIDPKAPRRIAAGQSLYGEYNTHSVVVNLYPLDETYQVRITDGMGEVVYGKAINTSNIVALNIDISAFKDGCYTITVDNSHESFTGNFEVQTTGIEEVRGKQNVARDIIYNLQGQRIRSLQKGLNIVNGRKVYVGGI